MESLGHPARVDESSKVALFAPLLKVAPGSIFLWSSENKNSHWIPSGTLLLLLCYFRRDWGTAKHTVKTVAEFMPVSSDRSLPFVAHGRATSRVNEGGKF